MPSELAPRRLLRRVLQVVALLTLLALVVVLAPGLGEVRDKLAGADPAWIALAIALELCSGVSYVVMFRPVFCRRMPWRTSWEISWSSLGMGSIVPASGAAGLALGAWILHEGGMPAERIARRSVAFFLIKSSVNFVAVAVIDPRLASTFARMSFLIIGAVGGGFTLFLALRGQDRALSLIPTWILFLIWIFGAAMVLAGRLSGDVVVSALAALEWSGESPRPKWSPAPRTASRWVPSRSSAPGPAATWSVRATSSCSMRCRWIRTAPAAWCPAPS